MASAAARLSRPPIHRDQRAVHFRRLGRGQPQQHLGDRLRPHPFRVIRARHGLAIRRRVDHPRQHRIRRDPGARHLQRHRSNQRVQRGLGNSVRAQPRRRLDARARAHRDDPSGARRQHRGQHLANHVERRPDVQVHHPVPFLVGRLAHRTAAGETAHHVHQRIQRPRAFGHATAALHRGQVGLHGMEASLGHGTAVPRARDPEDGGRSAVQKRLHHCRPQPARCAGH